MTNKAVSLKQITYKYKNSDTFALQNASLEVDEGDFLLLVGYSGSGKSTLLKTINRLIPNFHAGTFGGTVKLFGEDISETDTVLLAEKIGFVFQNPENQLSNLTVEREIAFPLENFGRPREEIRSRVDEIIELLNLENIRYKSPIAISGGEQQLTAIAAALALDPKLLVLDEVTAHLSPKSANAILSKLSDLNRDYNKTIIISEHRLDKCIKYSNKMAYIENGNIRTFGPTKEVLLSKKYPKELLPKIPKLFLKLASETNDFSNLKANYRKSFDLEQLPLTVSEFVQILHGGKTN